MNLLSTARALDDQAFQWRVMAACISHAAGFGTMTGNNFNYAATVMLNPQTVDPSMLALVALDGAVSDAIIVQADGAVDTGPVADTDVMRVVEARWALVAKKYPVDPLAG